MADLSKTLKRKIRLFMAVAVITGFLVICLTYMQIWDWEWLSVSSQIKQDSPTWEAKLNADTKVILLYTTLFFKKPWYDMEGSRLHNFFNDNECTWRNCLITYDDSKLERANAVLFHGRDVELGKGDYSADKLGALRERAPWGQKWVFLSHENPQTDIGFYKRFDGLFNWTSTYSYLSDIAVPYGSYKRVSNGTVRNHAQGKTGLVAWAVSHCNLLRQDYALQLQRYIKLTVYGKCNKYFENRRNCKQHDEKCIQEISNYKFILAFENDFCQDYVTEKYWAWVFKGVVPIVMGGNYDDRVVIPGSYIDVNNFKSIKELADYLHYLDGNDTAYNEYFKWQSSYEPISIEGRFIDYCAICETLNSAKFKEKSQVVLSEVFNYKRMCSEPFKERANALSKQIKESSETKT